MISVSCFESVGCRLYIGFRVVPCGNCCLIHMQLAYTLRAEGGVGLMQLCVYYIKIGMCFVISDKHKYSHKTKILEKNV